MIVQTRRAQLLSLFTSLVFILIPGVLGYFLFRSAAGLSADRARFLGEILLYVSLTGSVLAATVFGFIVYRNRNLLKELDRAVEMSLYSNFDPVRTVSRMGPIGEKITDLYKNLSQVSEMRSLKITALSALGDLLIGNIEFPAAVFDLEGELVKMNPQFRERILGEKNRRSGNIRDVDASLPIEEIIEGMNESYGPLEVKFADREFTFYPVHNRNRETAYIFAAPSRWQVNRESVPDRTPLPAKTPNRGSLIRRLLGKRQSDA
ncbi:MAG: hypothetical protein ACOCX6_00320 [bacterium]